ncbi:MAG: pilus assembly protein [Fuscovulum sp.]|nr:pilus assembly protein [Fuscovulum sp.]
MTARIRTARLRPGTPRSLPGDESGATLVEFAIVVSLFLLILFGMVDFGRLAYHVVTTERATHAAARLAAVRPPACAGVPDTNLRDTAGTGTYDYGTSCNAGGAICDNPGPVTCLGSAANATASEVWAVVQTTLPPEATISNIRFTYSYDPNLGFLGGPYVPVVTVELEDVAFDFVTPLSALAVVAGVAPGASAIPGSLTLPSQSASTPGEDLAQGENG